jgi:taurine dioxygenase
MSTLQITPIDGPLGAIATGVDLHQGLDPADERTVRAALADRLLLVVPDQFLEVDAERRVAHTFGPLWEHPGARHRPGGGSSAVLDSRRTPDRGRPAEVWHADATFTARPPAYTVLSAQIVPDRGGATSFANQQLAYTRLDDARRNRLEGLRAVHAPGPRQLRRAPWLTESTHPVVRVDPDTGRRSLFVNPGFTRRFGHLTVEQSRPYLAALFRVALDPGGVYHHDWSAGDLVIWDNRALLHRAHHDHGDEPRVLARVTVAA